jgi:hypothetical protein
MSSSHPSPATGASSSMSVEYAARILGAARERDSRLLVLALGQFSAESPASWWEQLHRLVLSRSVVDRLWIMGHVRIEAGRAYFEEMKSFHPDLLALAS